MTDRDNEFCGAPSGSPTAQPGAYEGQWVRTLRTFVKYPENTNCESCDRRALGTVIDSSFQGIGIVHPTTATGQVNICWVPK